MYVFIALQQYRHNNEVSIYFVFFLQNVDLLFLFMSFPGPWKASNERPVTSTSALISNTALPRLSREELEHEQCGCVAVVRGQAPQAFQRAAAIGTHSEATRRTGTAKTIRGAANLCRQINIP